ncbi:MAG TPA: DUF1800 family protein, partial [Armatimonadota bacterium]|nr:DUF1800 family protein [Armatimonadota bacterium]
LFSLGIGNYTEHDVKQGSRAWTGWGIAYDRDTGGGFRFNPQQHDDGIKTYLRRTGNFDGDDVLDIILEQPAAAEFLTRKLFTFFAYDNAEPEVITSLADVFRKSNYNVRTLMEAIFKSQAFWSAKAYNSQIKSPTQLVVGALRMLGYGQTAVEDAGGGQMGAESMGGAMGGMNMAGGRRGAAILYQMSNSLKAMGQDLFYPPNVKGWDGGPTWINSATMLERVNFAVRMANNLKPRGGPGSLQSLMGDTASGDPAQIVDTLAANLGPVELPAAARATLAKAIAGDGATLAANNRGYQRVARLRSAATLIMQSPLYQLC